MPTEHDAEQATVIGGEKEQPVSNVTPVAIVTEPIAPDVPTSVKYAEIIKSPRFHLLTLGFIIQILKYKGIIDDYIANAVTAYFIGVIGIGTIDRFNQKPAPAAPGTAPQVAGVSYNRK